MLQRRCSNSCRTGRAPIFGIYARFTEGAVHPRSRVKPHPARNALRRHSARLVCNDLASCPTLSVRAMRRSSPPEKLRPIPARRYWRRDCTALAHRLEQHRLARKSSSLGWLFGKRERAGPPLKGLYVHGEVGRGKTMLMDLFFATSAGEAQAARPFPRVHGRRARARSCLSAGDQERRGARTRIRSSAPPRPSPRKPGCCVSTNFTSPTLPTP